MSVILTNYLTTIRYPVNMEMFISLFLLSYILKMHFYIVWGYTFVFISCYVIYVPLCSFIWIGWVPGLHKFSDENMAKQSFEARNSKERGE
jgi:hypothetical protein